MDRNRLISELENYSDTFVEGYNAHKLKAGVPAKLMSEARKLDLLRDYYGLQYFNRDGSWARPKWVPTFSEHLFFLKHKILTRIFGKDHIYSVADQKCLWTIRGGENYAIESEASESKEYAVKFFKALIDELKIPKNASFLELGCGSGRNLLVLKEMGCTNLHGVDFSEPQVKFCVDMGLDVKPMEISKLDFDDNSFDIAFTNSVLLHIPPPIIDKVIIEAIRVARNYVAFREHSYETDSYEGHVYKRNYFKLMENLGHKAKIVGDFILFEKNLG